MQPTAVPAAHHHHANTGGLGQDMRILLGLGAGAVAPPARVIQRLSRGAGTKSDWMAETEENSPLESLGNTHTEEDSEG